MAKCKEIKIDGCLPFDVGGSDEMIRILGNLALPCCGLRCAFEHKPFEMRPNEHGGKTAMFNFSITGIESASWDYLKKIIREVEACGGEIYDARARDNDEGNTRWTRLVP